MARNFIIRALPDLKTFCLYVGLVLVVFIAHGTEPNVTVDQIYYLGRADEILRQHPEGDFWRSYDASRAFPVALAYLHAATGSHILSLKLVLAINTLAYLAAFQVLMLWVTRSRAQAVFFSLLSALFVSFGHTFWGFTEFMAALPRSMVVPFHVLVLWFYLSRIDSPRRFAVIPALIVLSWVHFSSLHVLLVLLVFEALHFGFDRRGRWRRDDAYLAVALLSAYGLKEAGEYLGIGVTGFVHEAITTALQASPETHAAAWKVEIATYPWRNLPVPMATLLATAVSFGPLLLLGIWGAWRQHQLDAKSREDRLMLMLAAAVLIGAVGLQLIMAVLRRITTVYPVNFEEIRAINLLVIPAIYFLCRLWVSVPAGPGPAQRLKRGAIIALCVIQPIIVIRLLPVSSKEALLQFAIDRQWLQPDDSVRADFARSFLAMPGDKPQLYYATTAMVAWLADHVRPTDIVLTDREEVHLTVAQPIGTSIAGYHLDAANPARIEWAAMTAEVRRALDTRDTDRVTALARRYEATYAIVPWAAGGAVYRDDCFSILRID